VRSVGTVGRDRPHLAGVESIIWVSSCLSSVSPSEQAKSAGSLVGRPPGWEGKEVGKVRKQTSEMDPGVTEEPGFRGEARQRLGYRQRAQLGIREPLEADTTFGRHRRRWEGVLVAPSIPTYAAVRKVSESSSTVTSTLDRWCARSSLDAFVASVEDHRSQRNPLESLI
jgi:hypothetical protein